jgi:hypothetical protein
MTLNELMREGHFSFKIEDDTNTVHFTYTEEFVEWFRETYDKDVNGESLQTWFNALLKESLDFYKARYPQSH